MVIQGIKTIELRKWNTKFRGKFLVHASKTSFKSDCEEWKFTSSQLDYGALIGTAELIDVKDYDKYLITEWSNDRRQHLAKNDFLSSTKGFILKNAQKFRYSIPYKGKLNFFDVPDSVIDRT